MLVTPPHPIGHPCHMRDWAIEYVLHVLEKRDWSANRLATEAGLATSTIARPLRDPDYPNKLSRATIAKIRDASGIDPAPFVPSEMAEDEAIFTQGIQTLAARSLATLDPADAPPDRPFRNQIKFVVDGKVAQIAATIDRAGIDMLRKKLDAIESVLDD